MSLDPCLGVESQLQPYLDRQLTPDEVSMIEQHLGTCAYCRERYHFEALCRAPNFRHLHQSGANVQTDIRSACHLFLSLVNAAIEPAAI